VGLELSQQGGGAAHQPERRNQDYPFLLVHINLATSRRSRERCQRLASLHLEHTRR
jgi:hypothetical protein